MPRLRPLLVLLFAAVLAAGFFWYQHQQPRLQQMRGATMGTSWSIRYVQGPHGVSRALVKQAVEAELERVNQSMSTWRPDSELMQLNRAPVGQAVPVSQPLFDLVARAQELSRLSAGAYDVTAGALVNLWGFGSQKDEARTADPATAGEEGPGSGTRPDPALASQLAAFLEEGGKTAPPAPEQIADALRRVGFQKLQLDSRQHTITRTGAVFIDLSSIAKGYGVDRVAASLEQQGIADYMVEVGGELRLRGRRPDNTPWRIAVRQPVLASRVQLILAPGDKAIATSGDYLNYYETGGAHFSHLIDARTGYPEQHRLASVTVVADTTALADAWATLLMILGEKKGLALAQEQGLDTCFIYHKNSGFALSTTGRFDSWRLDNKASDGPQDSRDRRENP